MNMVDCKILNYYIGSRGIAEPKHCGRIPCGACAAPWNGEEGQRNLPWYDYLYNAFIRINEGNVVTLIRGYAWECLLL